MTDQRRPENLIAEAVDTAASYLKAGAQSPPILITDDWGDRRTEQFAETGLEAARKKFEAFVDGATGEQTCALAYIGRHDLDQDAIVVELAIPGEHGARKFVQGFRAKRGLLHGFKLRGELRAIGAT